MKYYFILISLFIGSLELNAQEVTEVEMTLKKNLNNFWASKKSTLIIELHHIFTIPRDPGSDTIRKVFFQINTESYETLGVTSGISLFSAGRLFGGGASASKMEKLVKENEFMYMRPDQFFKMFQGMTSVYSYIKRLQLDNKTDHYTMAAFEDENIKFGGSYNPKSDTDQCQYYFKYNDAVFKMPEIEFKEIFKFMGQVRDTLNAHEPVPAIKKTLS